MPTKHRHLYAISLTSNEREGCFSFPRYFYFTGPYLLRMSHVHFWTSFNMRVLINTFQRIYRNIMRTSLTLIVPLYQNVHHSMPNCILLGARVGLFSLSSFLNPQFLYWKSSQSTQPYCTMNSSKHLQSFVWPWREDMAAVPILYYKLPVSYFCCFDRFVIIHSHSWEQWDIGVEWVREKCGDN